jgi:predicted nucleotidyltransferase
MLRGREGDFIELDDGTIFEVKGVSHPPHGVIAYPRYIPDEVGERVKEGRRYRKLQTLSEKEGFLKSRFPDYYTFDPYYQRELPIIPWSRVSRHYTPQHTVAELLAARELAGLRLKALRFIKYVAEIAGIALEKLGISGSLMLGLEGEGSDIDLVVYGLRESQKVRAAILKAMAEGKIIRRFTEEHLRDLYLSRSKDTQMSYEDFVRVELRKSNQGLFGDTPFFIRYLKDWGEVDERYGEYRIRRLGYAKIVGEVLDASQAHLTPAIYIIKDARVLSGPSWLTVDRVISWRGRFAEQACEGEAIVAQGYIEECVCKSGVLRQMVVGEGREDTILPIFNT